MTTSTSYEELVKPIVGERPKESGFVDAADQVVRHIASLIERRELRPGDRLAAERELAMELGVSRPTVRAGLHALAAMGVVESRQGAGTFIAAGPPRLGAGPLSFLTALHGFRREQLFEARKVLEVGAAGLAAERGRADRLAPMAEKVTGMFANLSEPQERRNHFHERHQHRISSGSGDREQRRLTVERALDLKESAEMHRRIYYAIRDRDPERARNEMAKPLDPARPSQALEELPATVKVVES